MKKTVGVILSLVFASSVLFSYGSLERSTLQNVGAAADNVEVWGASAIEKVMQDRQPAETVKRAAKISVLSAKNEYESAQIVMTANKSVSSYDVVINDLKLTGNSNVVYSKDNVEVYNQKYIRVTTITNPQPMPLGYYPDALLPFDKAKEYKENTIAESQNQSVFYSFYIPEDQPSGVYTGNFGLVIDGKQTTIPVTLEVYDIDVPTAVSQKSVFRITDYFAYGELDNTQAMLNAYNEALKDFRLSSGKLVMSNSHSQEDIAYFAEMALEAAQDERASTIVLPYKDTMLNGDRSFDQDIMKAYLRALVDKSFEANYNIFPKVVSYFTSIDEPYLHATWDRAKNVIALFESIRAEISAEVSRKTGVNEQLKADIAASILDIRCLLTNKHVDILDGYVETWVPHADDYHEASRRELYADQEEKWWYTCTWPKNPYPTYHIDDNLVSSRLLSWMQAEYGVTGNLYWATDIYLAYINNVYVYLEDYMQTADRYPTANGDGFLFYPGAQYGIYGPLGSIRLHSIRDGLEEYEILEDISEVYATMASTYGGSNMSSEEILASIYRKLYTGTKVATTTDIFETARKNVFQLSVLAEKAGVAIVNADIGSENAKYEILVKSGTELNVGDATKTLKGTKNGYSLYSVTQTFKTTNNYFNLSAVANGKTYTFSQYLGGPIYTYAAENYVSGVTVERGSAALVTGTSFGYNYKLAKLSFPDNSTQRKMHNARITGNILDKIGTNTQTLQIEIYNAGDAVEYEVCFKYAGSTTIGVVKTGILEKGKNVITVDNLYGYNWSNYQKVEMMYIYLGQERAAARDDIYLGNLRVFEL